MDFFEAIERTFDTIDQSLKVANRNMDAQKLEIKNRSIQAKLERRRIEEELLNIKPTALPKLPKK